MAHDSKSRFLQYLTGLALVAGGAQSATAHTAPPPPKPTVQENVSFADNLGDKIAATFVSAAPAPGPYKQTFGDVWALQWPWWQIIKSLDEPEPTRDVLLPSDAFKLVTDR